MAAFTFVLCNGLSQSIIRYFRRSLRNPFKFAILIRKVFKMCILICGKRRADTNYRFLAENHGIPQNRQAGNMYLRFSFFHAEVFMQESFFFSLGELMDCFLSRRRGFPPQLLRFLLIRFSRILQVYST